MNSDARIATSLPSHPKTKRLIRRLGPGAAWHLVCLFLWAAANRSTGDLSGMTDEDIELAVDWTGEPGALVAALVEVRFLDGAEGQREIHGWSEHNPWAAGAQARGAKARWNAIKRHHGERAADAAVPEYAAIRHARSMQEAAAQDASSMHAACTQDAARNAPSPSPSPSPIEIPLPVQETLPRPEQISSCAEPPKTAARAPAAAEDIACEMPAVGGKTVAVTKAQVREWAAAYPGIDVMAELAKARAWLISNPSRGKTPRGIPRYLNAWLARAQDDLGKTHGHADRPRGRYGGTPTLPERQKAAMADFLAREARLVNPNGGTPHARDGDRPVLGADDRDLRTPLVIDLRPRA